MERVLGAPAHAGMALCRVGDGDLPWWCPRPRGDGPMEDMDEGMARSVPPPTRGWPSLMALCCAHSAGAPAHAGMARLPTDPDTRCRWCPRPRGDGPTTPPHRTHHGSVPPPTRGWPFRRRRQLHHPAGAPAHAGMALLRPLDPGGVPRCPRPRGDGPWRIANPTQAAQVPPPTRGWPRHQPLRHVHHAGAPAHAGMALGDAGAKSRKTRCPRPRGDGPAERWGPGPLGQVPPPTRGWPFPGRLLTGHMVGAPAHAGMAPETGPLARRADRCPRPRGDGPGSITPTALDFSVPPPTRGWPRLAWHHGGGSGGAPAHAGMAPSFPCAANTCPRCPRPRGDGPGTTLTWQVSAEVPPPTRGWPPHARSDRRWAEGAPAHAGMAPDAAGRGALSPRCPRPRGDGPDLGTDGQNRTAVPPPTRGWPPQADA